MSSTFWIKNNRIIVDSSGHPVLCGHCPCEEEQCRYVAQLREQAAEQGWTWHGEGMVLNLAEYGSGSSLKYGDWYVRSTVPYYGDYRNCLCCAESADALYVVPCDCSGIETLSKEGKPAGYWKYIECAGACTCVDERELYLTYPDVFGIVDISFGSNTKYEYEYEDGWEGTIYIGRDMVGDKDRANYYDYERYDSFIDHRTFCYIRKVFDSYGDEKMRLGRISPQGSPQETKANIVTSSRIWFDGLFQPFAKDPDVSWTFTGRHLEWNASYDWQGNLSACGISAYDIPHFAPRVSPPDPSLAAPEEGATIYREQWIDTNLGLMRYGLDGHVESFTEYGIKDTRGDPSWGNCVGHSGVPSQDTTIRARHIDSEMHWCTPGFEIPDTEEPEE